MDYKVFYRKYRPKNFSELIGQDAIKEILTNSIRLGKIAHAYIFTGPRGTGKTSTAKIFAKTLNCLNNSSGISCDECEKCCSYNESADIIEIDAASNNGVEEIRNLRDSVKIAPYSSKYKVYIIDEVHMLSNSAWNAFLKTLEEPPSHVIFILATTEINKIPETVMSRCQRFDFSKISNKTMFSHLSNICKLENIDITDESLNEIVKMSNGCLRDALSDLDKVSKFSNKITLDVIESNFGLLTQNKLIELYDNITNGNIKEINSSIDEIVNSGITPLNFVNEFVNFLLNKIVNSVFNNKDELIFIKELIFKLNNLVANFNSFVNPFTLIKVELISNYFPGNNDVNISREIKNEKCEVDVNSREKSKVEKKSTINKELLVVNSNSDLIDIEKIKSTRVNNSFVNASKETKKQFINMWNKMCEQLTIENNYNVLGFFDSLNIEVVSSTNTIFSFPNINDAIVFNNNIREIEECFNNINHLNYRFIALSNEEWLREKDNFINNKDKKYVYIDETLIEKEENVVKNIDIAEDIFGNDLIEIR